MALPTGEEALENLTREDVIQALEASMKSGTNSNFYNEVGMQTPSRSYFIRHESGLHSLKAIVTFACKKYNEEIGSKDFHTHVAARRINMLKFDIVGNPAKQNEEREKKWIEQLARPEQAKFRADLIDVYRQCVLTKTKTVNVLEAAHIIPVAKGGRDTMDNGILLRADLHKLFDANLLAINPSTGAVALAAACAKDYSSLLVESVFVPPRGGPLLGAFAARWLEFLP